MTLAVGYHFDYHFVMYSLASFTENLVLLVSFTALFFFFGGGGVAMEGYTIPE